MKKKIYLILTIIISLFMFSGRVGAVSMWTECEFSSSCSGGITYYAFNDRNVFVPLTNSSGGVTLYAISQGNLFGAKFYEAWPLEDDYDSGSSNMGCWLKKTNGPFGASNWTCNSDIAYSNRSPYDIYLNSVCPTCLFSDKEFNLDDFIALDVFDETDRIRESEFVPAGDTKTPITKSEIEKTEYVIYRFVDGRGNWRLIAEGYAVGGDVGDGAYCYIGPNIFNANGDDISHYQILMLQKQGSEFWKVHENFQSRMVTSDMFLTGDDWFNGINVCSGLSESECKDNYKYETIIDSRDSNNNIRNAVIDWYNSYLSELESNSAIIGTISNSKLIETCDNINSTMIAGKSYKFSDYSVEELITDLEESYSALLKAYNSGTLPKDYSTGFATSTTSSMVSYAYKYLLEINKISDIAIKDSSRFSVNEKFIVTAIERDVENALKDYLYGSGQEDKLDVLYSIDHLEDYVLSFSTTIAYLDSSPISFGLSTEQHSRISDLRDKFEILISDEGLEIYPVVDCKGLIGEDLINKINSYLDIIKIVIPIILIGLGVFDFTKAIFSGEDDMKKAQQTFMKRVGIAIIIFLTPTFVNLLLTLANKVWPIITPNSCGIFEQF